MAAYTIEVLPRISNRVGTGGPTPTATEYLLMHGAVEERSFASEDEAARWAADTFKKWIAATGRNRNFPSDRMALLAWIGAEGALRDHDLFARVAEVLAGDGLATVPAPTLPEFQAQIGGFDRDHPFACPNCGAPRDTLRLVYPMQAAHRLLPASARLKYAVEKNYWEQIADARPQLHCLKCNARTSLPRGSTVIQVQDGNEVQLFGPDDS